MLITAFVSVHNLGIHT